MKVLGIGDNVCDVYVHQKRMYPGGQALNIAVNAKMLGAESEFLGVFGTDLIAACVKQALQTYGIPFPRSRYNRRFQGSYGNRQPEETEFV